MTARKNLALLLLIAVAMLWTLPSDVIELIVRQEDVILGRYSENHAYAALVLGPLLIGAATLLLSRVALDRQLFFRVSAVTLSGLFAFSVVDLVARRLAEPRYLVETLEQRDRWPHDWQTGMLRTRPPNARYAVHFVDEPDAARSYPDAPSGFPPVDITLSVDHRGFRNPPSLASSEIVALGDSFTEGSRVSDDEIWPIRLARSLGTPIYNLGMAGGSPRDYRNHLFAYLDELKPKTVLCTVYEGNDFRLHASHEPQSWLAERLEEARSRLKSSPIVLAFRAFVSDRLGGIHADAPVPESPALSWMPVEFEAGGGRQFYSFKPRRLTQLDLTEREFSESKGWKMAKKSLLELIRICREHEIRLIFIYAPSKPHVIMPMIEERLSPEQLHAFSAYRKAGLPTAAEFKKRFFDRIDNSEIVFFRFCEVEEIECISPTAALRERALEGQQVYYTYDQHWSRIGHQVVADSMRRHLESNPSTRSLSTDPRSGFERSLHDAISISSRGHRATLDP
ncbi:MAG: hypothetical protein GY910_19240 [bacterium]|nr:hypothetical protein [Deltaproteobacteria bacterium]MCP4907116.1 hypothetical protein [bacterium]